MTKYAMTSNTNMYPHPHVFSMSGPEREGILIRQVNATHALIIWDDEESWETANGVSQFPSELCELEV